MSYSWYNTTFFPFFLLDGTYLKEVLENSMCPNLLGHPLSLLSTRGPLLLYLYLHLDVKYYILGNALMTCTPTFQSVSWHLKSSYHSNGGKMCKHQGQEMKWQKLVKTARHLYREVKINIVFDVFFSTLDSEQLHWMNLKQSKIKRLQSCKFRLRFFWCLKNDSPSHLLIFVT